MKGQNYLILAFIFALLIAVFAVINVDPVQVNYLFGSGEAPLILVILISVLLGSLATASAGALRYFRLKKENNRLKAMAAPSQQNSPDPKEDKLEENKEYSEQKRSSSNVT
ncbi:Uncharacterized integral membrane protein [Halobacillus karajensis]|uniref:Integral membrane protein n=1 Tax=Halobacillus karajensis TaxID=195088 RepID=A0A024P5W5_9BACI|nr:lipopolysaccharide assembly protein LapA domain-containing protein [Halobacillus karajensis]CDQ18108.1 putative integral membrane protein [Halobacillus karajensis]CDQ24459.1 putative integral membrane protein [Halobacillus karajensis]CDQ29293.1 putative integral membrane protein [Halobacillus karajensis]SEH59123.1 Uncharacterized integral membrane protein [Halobacillus karajensis]